MDDTELSGVCIWNLSSQTAVTTMKSELSFNNYSRYIDCDVITNALVSSYRSRYVPRYPSRDITDICYQSPRNEPALNHMTAHTKPPSAFLSQSFFFFFSSSKSQRNQPRPPLSHFAPTAIVVAMCLLSDAVVLEIETMTQIVVVAPG